MLFVGSRSPAVNVQLDTIQSRPSSAPRYQWLGRPGGLFATAGLCRRRQTDVESNCRGQSRSLHCHGSSRPYSTSFCSAYVHKVGGHSPLTNWTKIRRRSFVTIAAIRFIRGDSWRRRGRTQTDSRLGLFTG